VDLTNPTTSQMGRIYINSVDATSSVNISSRTAFSTSTGAIWLGEEANGYLNPLLGNTDEVAMWVGSDERANIADIYNGGVPFDLSTLASAPSHWWRMGDGDSFGGGVWTLNDNIGSYNLDSVNMEEADRVTDVPGGVDTDAQAFITAASITDPTQQSAINQLVVDLKGYSIWTKMKAIYPFVGGTATTHKFNLKDPQDTDAAFRLVFSGGVTHSSTGIKGNGTNGYFDTFLNPSIVFDSTSGGSMFTYIRNNTVTGADLGAFQHIVNYRFQLTTRTTSNETIASALANNYILETNLDSRGFWGVTRPPSSGTYYFIKNANSSSNTDTYYEPNSKLLGLVLGFNSNPYAGTYSDHEFAFTCVADGLTTTESQNLRTSVITFQTALSRNV
jgi:hypothetical protein